MKKYYILFLFNFILSITINGMNELASLIEEDRYQAKVVQTNDVISEIYIETINGDLITHFTDCANKVINGDESSFSCKNGDETIEVILSLGDYITVFWTNNKGIVFFVSLSINEVFNQVIAHEMRVNEHIDESGNKKYTIAITALEEMFPVAQFDDCHGGINSTEMGTPSFSLECIDEKGHSVTVNSGKLIGTGSYELRSTYFTLNPYDQEIYFVGTITLPSSSPNSNLLSIL